MRSFGFTRQNPIKRGFRNRTSFDYLTAPTSYEITLTASTLVLARRRARFASLEDFFPFNKKYNERFISISCYRGIRHQDGLPGTLKANTWKTNIRFRARSCRRRCNCRLLSLED